MSRALVIEGQGGAAKTPVCHRLVELLDDAQYVHPFHEVSTALGHDVFELWATAPSHALALLTEAITRPRPASIVVYDRGWLTVCRGLEDSPSPELLDQALGLQRWTAFLDQDETWVRDHSRRLASQGLPPWDLTADFVARRRWADHCAWSTHLHGDADLDHIAQSIAEAWLASR